MTLGGKGSQIYLTKRRIDVPAATRARSSIRPAAAMPIAPACCTG